MNKNKQKSPYLTIWGDPNEMMQTQWGLIPHIEWCRREAERVGGGAKVATRPGECCIIKPEKA